MSKTALLDIFEEAQQPLEANKTNGLTGYRIYNAEQKRRTKRNDLPDLYPDLPEEKYDIIYADPPWDYGGKLQFDKSSAKAEKMDWNKNKIICRMRLVQNLGYKTNFQPNPSGCCQ